MTVIPFPKKHSSSENGRLSLVFCKHCLMKALKNISVDHNNIMSLRIRIFDDEGSAYYAYISLTQEAINTMFIENNAYLVDIAKYVTIHGITKENSISGNNTLPPYSKDSLTSHLAH